jgi:hypothetical protein
MVADAPPATKIRIPTITKIFMARPLEDEPGQSTKVKARFFCFLDEEPRQQKQEQFVNSGKAVSSSFLS